LLISAALVIFLIAVIFIFMCVIVQGNTSTAFRGVFWWAGLCRRKRRGLIVRGNMSTGTISGKKRQIICNRLIIFSRKYTMLLPATALMRGFPAAGYTQSRALENTVHEGGTALLYGRGGRSPIRHRSKDLLYSGPSRSLTMFRLSFVPPACSRALMS